GHGSPMSIDHFFRSLAAEQKTRAIGVVLSGNESDGALGLAAIRAEGGIALVQTEASAKHPDMPRAAIASGVADLVLSPEDIGHELNRIAHRLLTPAKPDEGNDSAWKRLFSLLKQRHGVDFAEFKPATLSRRVHRRMVLQRKHALDAYVEYVEENPTECSSLFEDLLINVTAFMRDPDVFAAFEAQVVPKLLSERDGQLPIR